MNIVFLDAGTVVLDGDIVFSGLQALGPLTTYDNTQPEDVIERAAVAEVIITNKVVLSRETIERLPKLKFIAVSATGYNNVDIAAARERGIGVSNVPGYSTDSVAQQVFAAILQHATHLAEYAADVARGDWEKSEVYTILRYSCFELREKKLGIIGFGDIGQAVGELGLAFGMQVLPYRRGAIADSRFERVELETVIQESDFLSIHCPLTPDTKNLLNADSLKKMKRTAFLINTARGGIVNEVDLVEALKSGVIAGAAVDVLSAEPPRDNALTAPGIPNLILTPHTAWAAREARQRLMEGVQANIEAYTRGEQRNSVNPA
ncbi:MAG: D-2-hydroxyacid dehydrogenase [Spirochaetia bacterium]